MHCACSKSCQIYQCDLSVNKNHMKQCWGHISKMVCHTMFSLFDGGTDSASDQISDESFAFHATVTWFHMPDQNHVRYLNVI